MREKTEKLPRDTWLTADHLWVSEDGIVRENDADRVRLCITSSGTLYMLRNTDGSQRKYAPPVRIHGEAARKTVSGKPCVVLHTETGRVALRRVAEV